MHFWQEKRIGNYLSSRNSIFLAQDLTSSGRSDILSDMKQVNARDFQKTFGQLASQLKSGQSLRVTKRGKPIGIFVKVGERQVKTPDFLANLEKHSYSQALGNQVMQEFYDSLS